MGIWDSLRLFSRRGGSHSRRGSKGKRGRGAKVSKPRDLRLEQFEDRVLLSITPYEGDDTYFVDDLGKGYFVDPPWDPASAPGGNASGSSNALARYPLSETFRLHSNPGASKVIYLDFDGHTTTGTNWNISYGDPIVTPAYDFDGNVSSFSTAELQEIQDAWDLVSEDYRPFDVDVTTQDPGVEALRNTGAGDTAWGVRVVIGENTWYGPAGGVAYVGSFDWDSDTPAFVFNVGFKGMAEAASHEAGHTVGLGHDGSTTLPPPNDVYYPGHGSGPTGWAPLFELPS